MTGLSGLGPSDDGNLRYVLRAYERPDCARLAAVMIGVGKSVVSRGELIDEWTRVWPHHGRTGAGKTIRRRVATALSLFATAKIIVRHGEMVTLVEPDRLMMVYRNLAVLVDQTGTAVPPREWTRRPECPPELAGVQAELELTRR